MLCDADAISADLRALFATDEDRWQAVAGRDARADGLFVYGVSTTGIYCRPTCPSPRPRPQRASFHDTCEEAERAGFRPCKRCRPHRAACPRVEAAFAVRPAAILFADLVGFTQLAAALPPDAALTLVAQFHGRLGGAVIRSGGAIHKHLGDGFMAVFGDDASRPDDARRAIEAALALRDALSAWNDERLRAGEKPLRVGVGVHYGMVAFGRTGGERSVIGDTVNVASRLERATRRIGASLAISAETLRAVETPIRRPLLERLQDAGTVRLPGCAPRRVWREREGSGAAIGRDVGEAAPACSGLGRRR